VDVAEGGEKFVLVHHDLPLESEPEEQRAYLEIAGRAAVRSDGLTWFSRTIFADESKRLSAGP
jgi:hypothetical protein